jgi:hypothetical protein
MKDKWIVQQYIWGASNLVEAAPKADIDAAGKVAMELGFDARLWLLGCSSERLSFSPSIVQMVMEEQMNIQIFNNYEAVAMN